MTTLTRKLKSCRGLCLKKIVHVAEGAFYYPNIYIFFSNLRNVFKAFFAALFPDLKVSTQFFPMFPFDPLFKGIERECWEGKDYAKYDWGLITKL